MGIYTPSYVEQAILSSEFKGQVVVSSFVQDTQWNQGSKLLFLDPSGAS